MSFDAGRLGRRAVVAFTLALCAQIGHAQGVSLYAGSKLVFGDNASVVQLDVPSSGVLSLTWTDLDFAAQLASLDVGLSTGGKPMAANQGDGNITLDLSGPANLYVSIFATAQGQMDVGLYHFVATFTPAVAAVPVPDLGIGGLGAGFLGVLALAYRHRRFYGRSAAHSRIGRLPHTAFDPVAMT